MTFDGATTDPTQQAVRDVLIGFMAASAKAQATKEAQKAGVAHARANGSRSGSKAYKGRKRSFKRVHRPYRSGRRCDWLKTKCVQSDTFVINGFQPGSGAVRTPLANIKVATSDGHALRYAGAVGTWFSEAVAASLRARLDRIVTPTCPVRGLKVKGAVWVSPDLRAEIAYRGTTTAGELRHVSFKGSADT